MFVIADNGPTKEQQKILNFWVNKKIKQKIIINQTSKNVSKESKK